MKNGDQAKLIQPAVEGEIVETRWNNEQDCKEHRLQWASAEGDVNDRWFLETELAPV